MLQSDHPVLSPAGTAVSIAYWLVGREVAHEFGNLLMCRTNVDIQPTQGLRGCHGRQSEYTEQDLPGAYVRGAFRRALLALGSMASLRKLTHC